MWTSNWSRSSAKGRSRRGRVLALALFLCVPASPAAAAPPAAAGEPLLLAVHVNGVDSGEVVPVLRLEDGGLAVAEEDLRKWRLLVPEAGALRVGGRRFIRLDDLPGVGYRIDTARQALLLQAPPSSFAASRVGAAGVPGTELTPAGAGGFLNYDLQWERAGGRSSHGGLFELGAFNRWGSGVATLLWNSANPSRSLVRLDTTWTVDMPGRMQSLRFGDVIGHAGSWGGAVRFGGVQWATNFSTQPGFVTYPMPSLHGEAVVPSTLDVYVNNARRLSGEVPAGPFDLTSVPVVTGQGEMRLVVRDLLGREQIIDQPYYVSPRLLRPGLDDFSLEAGVLREDYGSASGRYGRPFLAANERRGLSPSLTGELRAELLGDQQTAGAGAAWLVPGPGAVGLGTVNLAAAVSRGPQGGGRMVAAGVQRQARDLSLSLQIRYADRDFVQLGQAAGSSSRRTLNGNLGLPLGSGSLGVSYLDQDRWEDGDTRLLSVNYSRGLGRLGFVSLYALRSFSAEPDLTVGVMVTHAFDQRTSGSLDLSRSGDQDRQTLQLQRNPPAGDGFGYRLLAGRGSYEQYAAGGTLQTGRGTFTAEAARRGGASGYRLGYSGGTAAAAGGVFPGRRIDDSFAVVQVGDYAGVRVYRDNQEVARTDAGGRALVSRLRAYQENPIGIEQADLPLDAEVDTLLRRVTPSMRSGVAARFDVRASRGASFRLVAGDGTPLPAGAVVRIDGAEQRFPVGYGGRTFVTGLERRNRLLGEWPGHRCVAELPFGEAREPLPDLGTIVCKETTP